MIKLPTTGIPSAWILKQIAFPPPPSYFVPQFDHYGNQSIPPLITLKQQEEISETCQIIGLCPIAHCGLPSTIPSTTTTTTSTAPFEMPSQLTTSEQKRIDSYDRQMRIEENMMNMPDKIAQYKKEKRDLKLKNKSDLPF